MSENTGEHISPEKLLQIFRAGSVIVGPQTNRGWSLRQMFEMTLRLQYLIFAMNWTFLLAREEDEGFLTSDNPVALFDPQNRASGAIGFASSPASHFTFPLSRTICLLAQHYKGPETAQLNGSQVRLTNKGTIERADSQLYAPFKSASVQELLDHTVARRPRLRRVLLKEGQVIEE